MARPGLRSHRKFKRLVHNLKLPEPHILGYLELMWEIGYQCGNPFLGDTTDVELACQWPGEAGVLTSALLDCGFIDKREDGTFEIHDLLDHAPQYVTSRAKMESERRKTKRCENCRKSYRSADSRSLYCSHTCRSSAHRSRDGCVTDASVTVTDGSVTVTDRDTTPAPAPAPSPTPNKEKQGLPQKLDTPEFRAAWDDWKTYRKEIRHALTPSTIKSQLAQFVEWGPDEAILRIRESIKNGWRGVVFKQTHGPPKQADPNAGGREFVARGLQ